ncbi:MAG: TonB-dependent receptor [Bacteroidales bacterium]|nr:TonB-dependent receptor [Bacteroidales bacterium]
MKYFWVILFFAHFACSFGFAEGIDSVYNIDAVHVTKPRFEVLSIGTQVQSLDTFILRAGRNLALPELLTYAGLNVNNYGPGGLSTVSVRGLSASHTAVVWEEINLQSPMNGQFNLSVVPACFLDNASIQYGGSGVNYGSGTMTGIVHLGSSGFIQQPNHIWVSPSLGSFGNKSMGVGFKMGNNRLASGLKVFFQESDNDFPFKNTADYYQRTIRQTNAGMKQYGFMPQLFFRTSNRSVLKASCWIQHYGKDIQTMMTSSNPNLTHQDDDNFLMNVQWKYVDSAVVFSIRNAYVYNKILYFDPSQEATNNNSRSYVTELETRLWFLKNQWIQVGFNHTYDVAFSEGYSTDKPTRNRTALFLQYKVENIGKRANFMIGCRQEYVTYFVPIVYSAGFEYKISQYLRFSSNFSKNYRIPTLNDLFWKEDAFAKGNPNLKPEKGWSGEVSLQQHAVVWGLINLESSQSFFYNYISNWIIWQPNEISGKWQPVNKSKGKSEGFELKVKSICELTNFRTLTTVSYQYTHARTLQNNGVWSNYPPDYVPIYKANLSQAFVYKNMTLGYIHNYTGVRYSLGKRLPDFQVADLFLGITFNTSYLKTNLQLRINNLWNELYQVRQYYAMPMRNYLLTLTLDFSAKP